MFICKNHPPICYNTGIVKFDLHIHSCLSPCANLEMAPSEIVARAVAANNIVNSFAIALGTVVTAQLMSSGLLSTVGVLALVAGVNFLTALYLLAIRTERLPRK